MDKSFLDLANNIRKRLSGIDKLVPDKTSNYNSKLYMKECEICGSKEKLETHHIKEQHLSNENKMIGHIHQNDKHNIVCLCSDCHSKHTHKNGIIIRGWLETSQGKKLDYDIVENNNEIISKKKKLTINQVKIIEDFIEKYPKLSKKLLLNMIKNEAKLNISIYILKKIINKTYF